MTIGTGIINIKFWRSFLERGEKHHGRVCESVSCSILSQRTVACQAPLSIELSRQEYWSGSPVSSPGDRPYPGMELVSSALQGEV